MRIIRVFPERTSATPSDALVRVKCPPMLWDEADEVHISVTFTWHLPIAEALEKQWQHVAPVKIGGPATGEPSGDFVPGRYVKHGWIITSRGCPNKCWFCNVWRREGRQVRELPITPGTNIMDDNLLACSPEHISAVFAMLAEQKKVHNQIEFRGGLEAARLEQWHVDALRELRPRQMFFAYDTPDDLEPLQRAGQLLQQAGWTVASKRMRAYVLCGFPGDSIPEATSRMLQAYQAGFWPMAMVYRDSTGHRSMSWARWQRQWARPAIMNKLLRG